MRTTILLALVPLLGGCLKPMEDFPSLDRRPVETLQRESETPAPPTEPVFDAALASQLTALERAALEGHGRFEARLAELRPRIESARGSQALSEAWAGAEAALSALDASRGETAVAASTLDRMLIERSLAEAEGKVAPGGVLQIAESAGRVRTMVDEQQAVLDSLSRMLAEG